MTTPKPDKPDLAPSLGEQLGRVRKSFGALVSAHVALLKAEISEIAGQIGKMATIGGIVFALLLTMFNMLYIGGFLFMGEWLFGSMGWGLAQGVLFAISLSVVLVLLMVGASVARALVSVLIAIVLFVLLAVVLGTNIAYDTAKAVGANLPFPINSAPAVGSLAGLVIGGLLFAILLGRAFGRGGFIGGLVVGGLLGFIFGLPVGSAPWTWPPAWGFAFCLGLLLWPLINFSLAWPALDVGAYFSRLYPKQTLETVTETREWLSNQFQSRLPKRGKE
jgi:hypothetical protein